MRKFGVDKIKNLLLFWNWAEFPEQEGSFVSRSIITEYVRVLQDESKSGRERPWRENKQKSRDLAALYYALAGVRETKVNMLGEEVEMAADLEMLNKAERVASCGSWLEFGVCPEGHERRLKSAMFCQVRLCPMCSWRRSLMIFHQLNEVLHEAVKREKLKFIFLTLTVRNVSGEELSSAITHLFQSWQRLMQRKVVRDVTVGWFRALEVTRNPLRKDYHPHFHCLLGVKPSYFGSGYIKQSEWALLWKDALRVDYVPIVDVRTVKPKKGSQTVEAAVAEAGKYAVKPGDYLLEDSDEAAEAVRIFDQALRSRRLVAYGGLFREIRRDLKMEDPDTADLIKVDEDAIPEDCQCTVCRSGLMYEVYRWHIGLRNYVLEEKDE